MQEHTYRFEVKMTCSGCTGAVERVLSKLEGITSFQVSLEEQLVIVNGSVPYDKVYEKIKKTGKEVRVTVST
ncbi:heavy metal transport/detoxification protein [Ramaria rubella]|nr:heavy metal transport/detoxification protein [Ramaria rubella]